MISKYANNHQALNKITISKSMIKSTVFAKHIRGKNWFDDEVT